MKIFFDSEFTGLHQRTTLISIGFVSENGKEFYAESTDYDRNQIDEWLQENVINNLILTNETILSLIQKYDDYDTARIIGNLNLIRERLLLWLSQFDEIEVWSDCLSYDWILLSELIANRSKGYPQLPDNFIYHSPYDILTLFKMKGVDPDVNRQDFAEMSDGKAHNALWDAKVIQACYKKLMRLEWI
jgi:hypothetical protein